MTKSTFRFANVLDVPAQDVYQIDEPFDWSDTYCTDDGMIHMGVRPRQQE